MTDEDGLLSGSGPYGQDHVQMLREESRGWRAKAQEQGEAARRAREATARVQEKAEVARRAADERIIRAELRAAAGQAGMIDLDGLKMADLSGVTLDDAGVVQGADDVLTALRKTKPYLFGANGAPGSNSKPAGGKPRHASEMSKEEFERELQKLIRR